MGAGVRRLDDRLGLAVLRASLSGRTLVTYARDHVTVRTPSRPDFRAGNSLDLEVAPAPAALAGWVARFRDTVGRLGADGVRLRWEEPLAPDAPAVPPAPNPDLAAAATALGLELSVTTVLLLHALAPPAEAAPADLRPVPAPAPAGAPPALAAGGPVDRDWHAAIVLYRYETGERPDDWRGRDDAVTAWKVEVQRELAAAGRARVWLAARHGTPVGRLTLVHDRQGLAVVEDVIVHPAHRRRGIAAALTRRAVADHLTGHPGDRVGIGAEPGSTAELLSRRLGFRPHATVWTARRAP